jgi:hypothetical protein
MTTLREAATKALEALFYHTKQTRPISQTNEAIEQLTAALAEPEPEPVAWQLVTRRGPSELWIRLTAPTDDLDMWRPLYPAPPAQTPMTTAQISEAWQKACTQCEQTTAAHLVRAVEAHHGITGEGSDV